MHEEEFAHGRSLIHKLDPRLKIVMALAFSIIVAISTRYQVMLVALAGALVITAIARLSLSLVLKRMLIVNVFIFFIWVFLPFTTPGTKTAVVGPFTATREGIHLAFQITLKSNAIALAGMTLLSTSSLVDLGHALSNLKVPNKLIQLFFFTVRYSYTVHEEYLRLKNALKVRCFRPRTRLHTYRTYAYMMARLLLGSFERSGRILSAMKCRGFRNRFPVLKDMHFHSWDMLFVLMFLPFLLFLGIVQWTRILL